MKRYFLFTALALSACVASDTDSVSEPVLHKVWQVSRINQAAPPAAVSFEFRRDGSFSTYGGCNHLIAPYTLNGHNLTFGNAESTLRACENRPMEADDLVGTVVQQTRRYRIQNDRLELLDESGAVLLQAE